MGAESLHEFFVTSGGASAALIGLLFVAVSIQTERTFGPQASGFRFIFANSAFFVFGNILFVSLGALLPHVRIGIILLIAGGSGLSNVFLLLIDLWRRGFLRPTRPVILLGGLLTIYAGECWAGVALLISPSNGNALDNATYLLLFAYVAGLQRAWELLGGTDYSLVQTIRRAPHADTTGTTETAGTDAVPPQT